MKHKMSLLHLLFFSGSMILFHSLLVHQQVAYIKYNGDFIDLACKKSKFM